MIHDSVAHDRRPGASALHRSAATTPTVLLTAAVVTLSVLLGVTETASADTPAQRLARLRAEASRLNAHIDHSNRQIANLVEEHNANQVTLDETRAAEARTRQRLTVEEARLVRAQQQLDRRARAAYINRRGPLTNIAQFLGFRTVHEALTTMEYQARVIETDQELVTETVRARARLAETAADLRDQRTEQERIQRHLRAQKRAIEHRLAEQHAALARVSAEVRHALHQQRRETERRRQAAAARYAARVRAVAVPVASTTAVTSSGSGSAGSRAVQWALRQTGKPYRWGATGLSTFDCSGLTMRAYQAAGVQLPRTSRSQWTAGQHVARNNLRPGDLLFFGGSPATIHHVAMYVGGGRMVEAPYTGAQVRVVSMFRDNYVGAVRPTG